MAKVNIKTEIIIAFDRKFLFSPYMLQIKKDMKHEKLTNNEKKRNFAGRNVETWIINH